MDQQKAGTRLAAVLWLVAGALAFTAFAIDYTRRPDPRWFNVAAGAFCFVMAFAAWRRRDPPPPAA